MTHLNMSAERIEKNLKVGGGEREGGREGEQERKQLKGVGERKKEREGKGKGKRGGEVGGGREWRVKRKRVETGNWRGEGKPGYNSACTCMYACMLVTIVHVYQSYCIQGLYFTICILHPGHIKNAYTLSLCTL